MCNTDGSILALHMGDSFNKLSPVLQKSHLGHSRLTGVASVTQGNIIARLICRLFNLPQSGANIDLTVDCEHDTNTMSWRRNFNGHLMNSSFRRKGEHLIEKLGPFALTLKATEQQGSLIYQFSKTAFLGIPLPRTLGPRIVASERDHNGRYQFSVEVNMLCVGKLICYGGLLTVESV